MSGIFDIDQATWETWQQSGRFVLFGEAEWCSCDSVPSTDALGGHTHQSAAFVEAAQACETCVGTGVLFFPLSQLHVACPDCSNGHLRHPVRVPAVGEEYTGELVYCGWRTVAHATVEWGPGLVEVVECDHGKWTVQVDGRRYDADHVGLDLVGRVGQWAIGGTVEPC